MNFILSERDVLGLSASAIRSKIGGVMSLHVISRKHDSAKANARWRIHLDGLADQNKQVNRRMPCSADLSDDI